MLWTDELEPHFGQRDSHATPEIIEAVIGGEVWRKKTFKGHRWIALIQDETGTTCTCGFRTEKEAQDWADGHCREFGYVVGLVGKAEVVG